MASAMGGHSSARGGNKACCMVVLFGVLLIDAAPALAQIGNAVGSFIRGHDARVLVTTDKVRSRFAR